MSKVIKKLTLKEFLERVTESHDDIYDYSKVVMDGISKKVIIICKLHGEFNQTPLNHLEGHGCIKCGILSRSKKRNGSNKFIPNSNKIHCNLYDYSKVNYINCATPVNIICKKHGEFLQTPSAHLKGHGCKICGNIIASQYGNRKLTTQEFISRSKNIHNEVFDYSNTEYVTSLIKVRITCKIHGDFEVDPRKHIKGYGCPICTGCGVSHAQLEWLKYIENTTGNDIIYKGGKHNKEESFRFDCKLYRVDGYCKKTKTIYEFLGCWYHGCLECRDGDIIHPWSKKTMKQLSEEFTTRKNTFENNGYLVNYIWECKWKEQKLNKGNND